MSTLTSGRERSSGRLLRLPDHCVSRGAYQFRLFRSDGYSKLATSNDFTVASGSTTLTANPLTVPAGSPVTATWDGIASPAARDWIGLYLTTAPI